MPLTDRLQQNPTKNRCSAASTAVISWCQDGVNKRCTLQEITFPAENIVLYRLKLRYENGRQLALCEAKLVGVNYSEI